MQSIIIPGGVKNIGNGTFTSCSSLTSITIPKSVTSIGSGAFWGCSSLKSITIPESVTDIGVEVFSGCRNLIDFKVDANNSNYSCEAGVLYDKNRSTLICYPGGKTGIITIAKNVTTIGRSAFGDCSSLTSIIIPDSVTSIKELAFAGCSNLTSITIPNNVTFIGDYSAFYGCSSLVSITIPNNVTFIGENTFYGCSSLTSITIPNNVTSIGSGTFYGCSRLTSITISDSVTSISADAFENCDNLTIFGRKGSYAQTYAEENGIPFTIIEESQENQKKIADCKITISSDIYTYDGNEKKPTVTVKDSLTTLSSGTDYSLTYSNNINAGTATVTITGAGNYAGSISKNFTISAKPINDATVMLEKTSYTYDGTVKQPSVTVKDGSATLISGTHYTVSYSNNVNVGTATVIITGMGNYAGTISKTFTISANRRVFLWNQDNWNFNNSSYQGYFSSGKYIDQINSTYLNKLKNNLTNSEYKAIFDNRSGWLHDRFGGSCYGMSSTSLLAMENYLPYSDYGSGAKNLYQLRYPLASDSVSSLITYYQMLQVKNVIQQQYRTVPNKSNKENIQKIITLLDENRTVLIGFEKDGWGGHAVLAYGYEYGSYTWNGISYQGCIKICDPNSSKEYNGKCNIYFNTNSYNWTIPYYSSAPITSVSGAKFNYVGADVNEINYGGYLSGTSKVNVLDYVARIDAAAVSENRTVTKVSEVDGNYFPQNNAPGDIVEDYSYVLGGETAGTIGYNLYDAGSAYKLSQNNAEKLQLSIDYEDCYLEGGSAAGNNIIFDNDGYVSVSGESADYNISMTFDEDYPTDWFTIQIDGKNSDNASLEKCDLGYILSGDNLQNVEVRANNRQDSAHVRFTTKYQSAYIYEIDKDTIGVKVDADKNGTYETQISTEETHQYGSEWRTDDKSHWKECECGEKSELSAHKFKWVIDKNASIHESGFKHEECVICGYRRNENTVIGKLDNTPAKGKKLTGRKSGAAYKVVIAKTKGGTVEYTKPLNNKTANISIPSTVKIDGISYKVTSIAANAFKNNKKITKVKIGSNVTTMGKNAFNGCSKLKTLTIGNNVVSIGDNAFLNCTSIKTVIIPAKVKKIGKQAFCGCKRLKTIKLNTKKLVSKNVGSKAFAKIDPRATVKVPASCLKSYKKLLQKKGLNGKKQKIKK